MDQNSDTKKQENKDTTLIGYLAVLGGLALFLYLTYIAIKWFQG